MRSLRGRIRMSCGGELFWKRYKIDTGQSGLRRAKLSLCKYAFFVFSPAQRHARAQSPVFSRRGHVEPWPCPYTSTHTRTPPNAEFLTLFSDVPTRNRPGQNEERRARTSGGGVKTLVCVCARVRTHAHTGAVWTPPAVATGPACLRWNRLILCVPCTTTTYCNNNNIQTGIITTPTTTNAATVGRRRRHKRQSAGRSRGDVHTNDAAAATAKTECRPRTILLKFYEIKNGSILFGGNVSFLSDPKVEVFFSICRRGSHTAKLVSPSLGGHDDCIVVSCWRSRHYIILHSYTKYTFVGF